MPPPHNPHDSLVKRIFSDPEAAAAELRLVLPAPLVQRLDWATLLLQSGSFVDAELRHRTSDLLYSINLRDAGPNVLVYVLLEHQSTVDPLMAVRFFVYVGRIYEHYLRSEPSAKTVPLVVPVLLFQGRDEWSAPRSLSGCLQLTDDLRDVLMPPVELWFDIDELSESAVKGFGRAQLRRERGLAMAELARSLLWLVRHPEASTGERAALLAELIDAVVETEGIDGVRPFFAYLLSAFESRTPIRGIVLSAVNKETRQLYVTIRDELLAQGHKAGVVVGKADMLLELLHTRGLAVSEAQRRRIRACTDEALLRQWFVAAVNARSTDDVIGD